MKKLLAGLTASALVAFSGIANAIVITIPSNIALAQEVAPGIQQSAQGPCVIGDPSCNSNTTANIATFGLLPAGGNVDDYDDEFSPVYNVGSFRLDSGNMFDIGIDINVTGNQGADHRLRHFVALIDGDQVFAYDGNAALSGFLNPGNGFSDWRLTGFDLTGIADSSTIQFGLDMGDVDAGRDQFFVIPGAPPVIPPGQVVPEPGMLGLLGIGLLGLRRLRKRV